MILFIKGEFMQYKNLEKFFYNSKQEYEEKYAEYFNDLATQKLDFEINGNQAFYVCAQEVTKLLYDIMQANRKLDRICNSLPGVALSQYRRNRLIDEINITNEIEGVHSTKREISDILDNISKDKSLRFLNLVKKYERIMDGDEISLHTCEDVRKLYDEIVLPEVVAECPNNRPDGKYFRKSSVSVWSNKQQQIHVGIMPEEAINNAMDKALAILNDNNGNRLINIAIFHYLLGYIHPFYDGNGRMNRFISSYMLSKELNYLISYGLSTVIKENKARYNKLFNITNNKINRGDLTLFILNFLEFIKISLLHMADKLEEKAVRLDYYEAVLQKIYKGKEKYFNVIFYLLQNTLFGFEGLKMTDLKDMLLFSYPVIKNVLEENKDIVVSKKIGKRDVYSIDLRELDKVNM